MRDRAHAESRDADTAVARSVATAVDAFRRIVRDLRLAAKRTETAAGFSAAQLFVLTALADEPADSMTELGARVLTDRSSVAIVVDRLVERGLARRQPSREDRRRTTVAITPAGRALLRRMPAPPTAALIAGLRALDAGTLHALATGLAALTDRLGIAGRPAGLLFEEASPEQAPRLVARRRGSGAASAERTTAASSAARRRRGTPHG